MNDLILYTTEDGRSQIKLRAQEQTVWLTQLEMAELFDATKQNISLHLKNLFEDGELDADSVVKESLTTAAELSTTFRDFRMVVDTGTTRPDAETLDAPTYSRYWARFMRSVMRPTLLRHGNRTAHMTNCNPPRSDRSTGQVVCRLWQS